MNRQAVIYTRVSTDEQAQLGTSLKDQEEAIRRYCSANNMDIIAHYQDDCSGRTFDRPEFNRFLTDLLSRKIKPDVLVVARMDRFSRDTRNALNMWTKLKELSVELITCDTNFDLSVPENFLPFILQVVLPQVENERRGLNTRNGMRSASRDGRYMGKAPRGYDNAKYGDKKHIVLNDKVAPLVKMAFEEVAKQIYTVNEIRRRMKREGLDVSRSQFYNMLRNPIYIGKIYIKAWREEPEEIVDGIHEPLIDRSLFYKVQDVLDGKKKPYIRTSRNDNHLPLRGHLICPVCDNLLTGSGSTNAYKRKYYYYHCQNGCKERYKAHLLNEEFIRLLESIQMPEEILMLYREFLKDVFKENHQTKQQKLKLIETEIEKYQSKLDDATDRLIENDISNSAYKRAEERYTAKVNELQEKIYTLRTTISPIEDYIDSGVILLSDVSTYYVNADLETKKLIVSSIFPQNLIYDGEIYRTSEINAFIAQMHSDIKVYEEGGKEKASISESLSTEVAPTRIELVSKV